MSRSVSIVTTLYKSEPFIEEFYRRVKDLMSRRELEHEVIFVNDGSPDQSLAVAWRIAKSDPCVTVVDLSRNFGHHKAMMTGLSYSRLDLVFLVDVDLEEPPELLDRYLSAIKENPEFDVIYGVQEARKGKVFERISGEIFYTLFNWLSADELPRNMALSRLMTRRYVDSLVSFRERNLFIPGIWHLMGYEQKGITIQKASRGESSYTLKKKVAHFVDALTSFSDAPLNLIFYTGVITCIASFTLALFFIGVKLFYGVRVSGWTSLMVLSSMLSGVVILFLGIIGIYLSKMFIEIKQRPYTIVRDVFPRRSREARKPDDPEPSSRGDHADGNR